MIENEQHITEGDQEIIEQNQSENEAEIASNNAEVEQRNAEIEKAKESLIASLNKGNVDAALKIKDEFGLPPEVVQDPEIQVAAREGFIYWFKLGSVDNALKIKDKFALPPEIIEEPEFQAAVRKKLVFSLEIRHASSGRDALEIIDEFGLPPEVVQDPEVQSAARKGLIEVLEWGNIDRALEIRDKFALPTEVWQSAVRESLIDKIRGGNIDSALKIIDKFGLPPGVVEYPEVQSAARAGLRACLHGGSVDRALEIRDKFALPTEVWQSAAREGLILWLRGGRYTLKIKDGFTLPPEVIQDPEVQSVARERLIVYLEAGIVDCALEIKDKFALPAEFWQSAVREELTASLKKGDIGKALKIKDGFALPPEVIQDPEVQSAAQEGLLVLLKRSWISLSVEAALEIIDGFSPPAEFWQSAVREELTASLKKGDIGKALKIKDGFALPPEIWLSAAQEVLSALLKADEVDHALELKDKLALPPEIWLSAAQEELIASLKKGDIGKALKIKEQCGLSLEIISGPEIQGAIKQLLLEFLSAWNANEAINLKDAFNLTQEVIAQIDQEVVISNDIKLIGIIPQLGDTKAESTFPHTFGRLTLFILDQLVGDEDLADYFIENLHKYYTKPWSVGMVKQAIIHYSVAKKFADIFDAGQAVWANEPWADDVILAVRSVIEQHKTQHQQNFDSEDEWEDDEGNYHGYEGFSEIDPYETHSWRFGGKQVRIASALSELMAGETDTQAMEELGINVGEIMPTLAQANEKIDTAYQHFLEQVRTCPHIKDEDKQALLNPDSNSVRMTPLLDNIRSLVARYFVQSVEGDVTRLPEIGDIAISLDGILVEGFSRYFKVHEVDVPLYDKLYEEFDNLRETGRNPLEVYLGRDGIYAYLGRRAQDAARRRKIGFEGRRNLREMGEVVEINPMYLVYPRYFRDDLNYDTKRQFLEQEGISPDADPLFYDTGYTGTIPEQIMRIMDFDEADIERRIRLLSAPSPHRRVKGIPENARSDVIEYIEHNAKTENTAVGLIIDEKTGKIRHIAEPVSPEEQFYFMMVKQAITRHYWLQEQLHHEPSGNINIDSEHYSVRIRQEYAELLPQEFLHDPKVFFAQHGTLLKGSKGEGEFPDEEVVLFQLTDGTEIVAKRIELRKAKEARKEFAILIAAKKAGLPTAEPVGFLSGKQDDDGSYLLMGKLEGRSGRKFEKGLRESGRYSDEQIHSIMQQVADKNEEMAELFRDTLHIDKRWRIKDTIIEFNEETGEIARIIPIDWERAEPYDSNNPKAIDEIPSSELT